MSQVSKSLLGDEGHTVYGQACIILVGP